MDYDSMTKDELIQYIKDIRKKRAFTYEDQMKLAILDESPFTLWASDRDCLIKLWEGQCESLYNYPREYAIGKDYIELFVAPEERVQARIDQISIIDEGQRFHNIANDNGRNGNILQLITNCFRIKDPLSGDYWNAEMGLIIDFYDQEKERLEHIVTESKKIKSCVTQYIESQQQFNEQFTERKNKLIKVIKDGERNALKNLKRSEFKDRISSIFERIEIIESSLSQTIENYSNKIKNSTSSIECERIRVEFMGKCSIILTQFDELLLDYEEISIDLCGGQNIDILLFEIMREITSKNTELKELAYEIYKKAEDHLTTFKSLSGDTSGEHYNKLLYHKDQVSQYKKEIDKTAEDLLALLVSADSAEKIDRVKRQIKETFDSISDKLIVLKKTVENEE